MKIACFFGLHSYSEPKNDTFGIIMQLGKRSCRVCPKTEYWWSTFSSGKIPVDEEKYNSLLSSMVDLSKVSQETRAGIMTHHFEGGQ